MEATNSVYSSYVYQPLQGTNPNFWVTTPFAYKGNHAPSGPAGGDANTGAGEAYHATFNTAGPTRVSWLSVNGGTAPSNSNTLWAFNNPGFQIPRAGLWAGSGQTQALAYEMVAGDGWSFFSFKR